MKTSLGVKYQHFGEKCVALFAESLTVSLAIMTCMLTQSWAASREGVNGGPGEPPQATVTGDIEGATTAESP